VDAHVPSALQRRSTPINRKEESMRKLKGIILMLLVVASALALVTCAAKPTNLVLMHDKGGNPDYRPFYEQLGTMAKAAVGVGFTQSPYPDTNAFQAAVRAALPTDKAPDLFTWWSTYRMKDLIDENLVADMTDLWNKHKDEYPQGLRDAFTFNGKVYGLAYVVEYWGVWYNKDVFAKYNLSVPTTWDEFLKVCETLKKNKVTPRAGGRPSSCSRRWWPARIRSCTSTSAKARSSTPIPA
jgi:ABC-type glycerol-3-phosphate transport system substrate-binding protein